MTNKFTPGPWSIEVEDSRTLITGDGMSLAKILLTHTNLSEYSEHVARAKANAKLIAASPDLLEACLTFAKWLSREGEGFVKAGNKRDTPEGERRWREWYDENLRLCNLAQKQAIDAIVKATR